MGRDFTFLIIEDEEHLQLFKEYDKLKGEGKRDMLQKYNFQYHWDEHGRNAFEYMDDKIFTGKEIKEWAHEIINKEEWDKLKVISNILCRFGEVEAKYVVISNQ
jgi:hypothetical protein